MLSSLNLLFLSQPSCIWSWRAQKPGNANGPNKSLLSLTKRNTNQNGQIKLSLFANDLIIHTENPKESKKNYTVELISKFGIVAWYTLNLWNQLHIICILYVLFTVNEHMDTKIKKKILFTIAQWLWIHWNTMKYLCVNLTKHI